MNRATQVLGQGRWHDNPADTVVLDFDDRHRRRIMMTGTRGLAFLLDLETAVALRGGDALVLDDGRLIEIVAAPEALIEIRGTDPQHLVRIGWHLGNRHLPTQITARGLRIRRDHVIEDMLRGLGARLIEIEAPFDPEGGAYTEAAPAQDHAHGHGHAHHGHDHDGHVQGQGQGEGHVHDEHCGHDHKQDHKQDHGHKHAHAHPHDHGH